MATNESAQKTTMQGEPWVSANLLGNVDPDYNPGPEEDFYLYVNRDFTLEGKIDDGEVQNVPMMMIPKHRTQDRCAELLAEGGSSESDIRSAQNYYNLIRNWEWRDKTGIEPLDEMLKRIDAASSIDELNELFCDPDPVRRMDLMGVTVMQDLLEGTKHAAYAEMSVYSIHKDSAEYAETTPTGQVFLKVAHDTFVFVASKTSIADRAEAIFEASLAYQTEMAARYHTKADMAVPGTAEELVKNRLTKDELIKTLAPFPVERALVAHGFDDVDVFIVPEIEADKYVVAHYDEEHLEGIKAYLMTTLVKAAPSILTSEIYEGAKHIRSEAMGSTYKNDEEDQRRNAFDTVFEDLPSAVSKLYVSRYGDEEVRNEVRSLCEDVVRVYKKMLQKEDWLSESTRAYAIKKLEAMYFRVCYPDKWEDYSALDIRSAEEGETLWSAAFKVHAFKETLAHDKIGKGVDIEIMSECIESNCNYNQYNNSINIYLGFLSEITFQAGMSIEEKLGGLGMVVGHEISHGFDVNGKLNDAQGLPNEWWTEEDNAAFEVRSKKAMDWYENVYKPRTENVPGIGQRCVGETFADLGALSVALTLAREVEGFDYDKFFRSFARVWQSLNNEFAFDYLIQTDEHPMGAVRVNLALAQSDEFHKTYGVKEGDKMYFAPEDRIRLW